MAGADNLKPYTFGTEGRSAEEARECGQKGGIASGEARRRNKMLKDSIIAQLEANSDKRAGDLVQDDIVAAVIAQAKRGNVKAAEFLRDTIGEKPVEKVDSNTRLSAEAVTITFEGDLDAWSK